MRRRTNKFPTTISLMPSNLPKGPSRLGSKLSWASITSPTPLPLLFILASWHSCLRISITQRIAPAVLGLTKSKRTTLIYQNASPRPLLLLNDDPLPPHLLPLNAGPSHSRTVYRLLTPCPPPHVLPKGTPPIGSENPRQHPILHPRKATQLVAVNRPRGLINESASG